MAIFLSAGHHLKDSGAVANNYTESSINIEFKELVLKELKKSNHKIIVDDDKENLTQYLNRIKTGSGSVVLEFHCDASSNLYASGTTAIIADSYNILSQQFALELVTKTSEILQIRNRGIFLEKDTNRKKIAITRKAGTACLLELFFLTNKKDLEQYQKHKTILAKELSQIIIKYENLK